MNSTNRNCLNKCKNYPNCKPCSVNDWKNRYDAYMLGMGWKPKDLADKLNRKVNSIYVSISKDELADTFKLAIITYEHMLLKGQITYNNDTIAH